uniref:Uncharacterized protein n=1 Tax=Oryctolagus cuniculus TaxID=9986 RepID=A0A5F9D3I6_RABIT
MGDGKAGEEKPEKPPRTGAAGLMDGKAPAAAFWRNQLQKLQTSQQNLQRSPSLDLPQVVRCQRKHQPYPSNLDQITLKKLF